MGDIIQAGEYENIRASLGVPLTLVSDATIELLNYLPLVEGEIKEIVADWETVLAGDDQDTTRLKLATCAWVAARLCGYLQRNEARDYKVGDYAQRPTKIDWTEKARELSAEAAENLAAISTSADVARQTFFVRDGPTRSGTRTPAAFSEWLDKIEPTVIDWLENEATE